MLIKRVKDSANCWDNISQQPTNKFCTFKEINISGKAGIENTI